MNIKFPFNPFICYCWGSGAGDEIVEAQKLANEGNIAQTNLANQWNWNNLQAQNQWNIEQWQRENDYNTPANQIQRYIQAGINPMYALGNVTSGNAQQLTSADPLPAEVPHIIPEVDAGKADRQVNAIQGVMAASNSLLNSGQGFYKLALESEDVRTRSRAQRSQEALNRAEALYKKSQTEGQQIFNNLNTETYSTQIQSKVAEYNRIKQDIELKKKEGENYEASTKNLGATYDQIRAMTDFTRTQSDAILDQLKQGWKRLEIEQQNANTSQFSAQSQSYYSGENLKLSNRQFEFSVEKAASDLKLQSNNQILKFVQDSRSQYEKFIGVTKDGAFSENLNPDILANLKAAGDVLYKRVLDSPTESNVQSYQEYLNQLNELPSAPIMQKQQSQTYNILNPSQPW